MSRNKTKPFTEDYGSTAAYGSMEYSHYLKDRTLLPFFLILFLISPVLALISAMFNFRKRGARLIVFLFMTALGYTWILIPGMDSHTVSMWFLEKFQHMSYAEFINNMGDMLILRPAGAYPEPFMPILSYTLVQFTSSTSLFMMVAGLFFGLAYVKGISLVYEEREGNWDYTTLILFIFFINVIYIVGLNAPRNYIGGCTYFAGAYLFLKKQDYRYLLIVLLAPMIHFAYLAITLPFFVYVGFKDRKIIYAAVLVLSFIAGAELSVLEPYLTSTELGENKVESYTGDHVDPDAAPATFEREKTSFHAKYYDTAGRWAIIVMFIYGIVFIGYFSGKYHDKLQSGLGSVSVLTLSFANFAQVVPALQNRTMNLFALFALAYLVRLFSKEAVKNKSHAWIVYLSTPIILFFVFTMNSRAGDYIDFKILVSPLLYPFLSDDATSIKEFIRIILNL